MLKAIGRVDRRTESPRVAIIVCALVAAVIAGFGSYNQLAVTISGGTIVAYGIVCASVLRLRRQRPDLERPSELPLGPVVPIAGIVGWRSCSSSFHPGRWSSWRAGSRAGCGLVLLHAPRISKGR